MTKRRRSFLLLMGAYLLATSASAPASTSRRYSLAQLVQQSDATVLGHPLAHESFWRDGRIVTRTRVALDEVWTGPLHAGRSIDVLTLGGVVGDIGQRVEGAAVLPGYGRVVLHLRRAPLGFVPTAMAQGVWRIDTLYGSRAAVQQQGVFGARGAQPAVLAGESPPQDLAALRAAVMEAARGKP